MGCIYCTYNAHRAPASLCVVPPPPSVTPGTMPTHALEQHGSPRLGCSPRATRLLLNHHSAFAHPAFRLHAGRDGISGPLVPAYSGALSNQQQHIGVGVGISLLWCREDGVDYKGFSY